MKQVLPGSIHFSALQNYRGTEVYTDFAPLLSEATPTHRSMFVLDISFNFVGFFSSQLGSRHIPLLFLFLLSSTMLLLSWGGWAKIFRRSREKHCSWGSTEASFTAALIHMLQSLVRVAGHGVKSHIPALSMTWIRGAVAFPSTSHQFTRKQKHCSVYIP